MIPEQFKSQVIEEGIAFVRTITEAYGAEDGMKLWEQIAAVLDPDVKGEMFFAMITGTPLHTITVTDVTAHSRNNKIEMIKTIRAVTGWGLKEAKDAADNMWVNSFPVKLVILPKMRKAEAEQQLRVAGCVM